jgi:hypothetical protein
MHVYQVHPRKDERGVDLISDVLPFGRLWYGEPNATSNAIGYANFYSRSHDAVIRVFYDEPRRRDSRRTSTRAISRSGEQRPRLPVVQTHASEPYGGAGGANPVRSTKESLNHRGDGRS